MEGAEPVGR